MDRRPGLSVRLKLTLTYLGFLLVAYLLLLGAAWLFLLRGHPGLFRFPTSDDFGRALNPHDFGPAVFVPSAIMVFAFLVVFGTFGGWVLAGRVLAPLAQITAATRRTSSGTFDHRIDMAGRGDEFRELADNFDAMLGRLAAHEAEQKRFVANASHELRTPLAITQALLDVAKSDPDQDAGELHDRLRSVNTRAIDLAEALLVLSRADQGTFVTEPVDLSLVAEEAAESLLPLAERNEIELTTCADTAIVTGSYALLLQMTMNLVHNAIVHNVAVGGVVRITTRSEPDSTTMTVENSGAPVSSDLVATLTEPFHRGTDRPHGDGAGFGLGLAIAKSVIEAHGGRLTLVPRQEGGLTARVLLPHGPPPVQRKAD